MYNTPSQCNDDIKKSSITLSVDWMDRLAAVASKDRQSSAAAEVRLMIMEKEDQHKIKIKKVNSS